MQVIVALEHRFFKDERGNIWSSASIGYDFWQRYLRVFDEVKVIARVEACKKIPGGATSSQGRQVEFIELPCYVGPFEYMRNRHEIRRIIANSITRDSAFILRVPGNIGRMVWGEICRQGIPYAAEVVGDPREVFRKGSVKHPLRILFRGYSSHILMAQCSRATAVAYVSKSLRIKYPCRGYYEIYSSVFLSGEDILDKPRVYTKKDHYNIVFIGSLDQLYKAPDILIDAAAICISDGLDLKVEVIGDGKYRGELVERARRLGLEENIRFLGRIPSGRPIFEMLDKADIFVLPSRTEGLPRAMIEAMGRGLPCIGTNVGGIPEILKREDMVAPNDSRELASKIEEVLSNPERLNIMSARNLVKAEDFLDETLSRKRTRFYQHIRGVTEEWFEEKGSGEMAIHRG